MARGPLKFRQADLARAVKVAEQATKPFSVDLLADGTIRLTPIHPQGQRNVPADEERPIVL